MSEMNRASYTIKQERMFPLRLYMQVTLLTYNVILRNLITLRQEMKIFVRGLR